MRIRYAGKLWDVWLEDDGTTDTVISIQPVARPKDYRAIGKLVDAARAQGFTLHTYQGLGNSNCGLCGNTLNHPIHEDSPSTYPTDSQGAYYPSEEVRFDCEYASDYRRPNGEMTMRGLRMLGEEAAETYDFGEGSDNGN